MQAKIVTIPARKLVGMHLDTSLVENRTAQLFQSFMPRKGEIRSVISPLVYDLKVYPSTYFQSFSPHNSFVKWALLEVEEFGHIPEGMAGFELSGGIYASFLHRGYMHDNSTFEYIFREWLPPSEFEVDQRPHFELLSEKSKRNDPNSEEEIWIPIRPKL